MSSFWIPNLVGQLYTMTGHVNRLNMVADVPGSYPGSSAEINGSGFAGMKFVANVTHEEEFESWVRQVKQSPDVLDEGTYENLIKPSEKNQTVFYSTYERNLFSSVVSKYTSSHQDSHNQTEEHE